MKESIQQNYSGHKPAGEQSPIKGVQVPLQAAESQMEVERRIAHMEAMQDFLLAKKRRSRPLWKKILGIK